MRHWIAAAVFSVAVLMSCGASAQVPPVGRCVANTYGQSFVMYPNGLMVMEQNPANQGFAVRDPSGMNFLRLPAANPFVNAYFAAWTGELIEVTANVGMRIIGSCQFAPGVMPQNPVQYQAPQMAQWGVRVGNAVQPVPQQLAVQQQRYVRPLLASPQTAQQCMSQSGGDEKTFADCMVKNMVGPREEAVYECAKSSPNKEEFAFCTIGALGGQNERKAADQIKKCYDKFGGDINQYPLCLAEQNVDQNTQRLIGCVQQQAQGGDVTVMGTAMCYGANSLDLNPELQIAVECAAASGGEPMTFAGCTGGRLTERELTKCFTDGIGGNGCFGPNNEIVKALQGVGIKLDDAFGPTNDIVRNWNNAVSDIQNGPGQNNDAVKAVTTIANDLTNGPGPNNDVVKAIDNVIPGFSSLF